MIKEIKITNFYSFNNTTVKLQPDINILIGINGAGSSNKVSQFVVLKNSCYLISSIPLEPSLLNGSIHKRPSIKLWAAGEIIPSSKPTGG